MLMDRHTDRCMTKLTVSLFAILRMRLKIIETGEDGAIMDESSKLVQES
jgi:hypothetical protein